LNNGINTATVQLYRKPYVAAERDRAILFVGRLTQKANLGLLLSAMTNPSLKSAVLHVVGTSEAESTLRAKADELGISGQVVWHGSTSDEAVIAAVANRCRLFVYPGEVGLSLIHGMAYGLPCVVHSDPLRHMPEIAAFRAGETGRTFTNNDVNTLARTIAEMMDATNDLERFSENCIKITDSDFNTTSMARRFINLVEHLDLRGAQA
jgi:glycosyltransferase involved in cell wall biosynthesis